MSNYQFAAFAMFGGMFLATLAILVSYGLAQGSLQVFKYEKVSFDSFLILGSMVSVSFICSFFIAKTI